VNQGLSESSRTSGREAVCLKTMESKRLKIAVGMPSASEFLHTKFVQCLIALEYPPNTDVRFISTLGVQLPFARNYIVSEALKSHSDYLFFIDVDMTFPPDALKRLLEHKLNIVNALAFRRIKPHYPCIFKWNDIEKSYNTMAYYHGLVSVDATGMSCMLIKMDVFKKMKPPYYYYKDHLFSSDLTWCSNALKLGYKIWVDSSLKIGHIGSNQVIDENYYIAHLSPEAKKKWNNGLRGFLNKRARDKELYKRN